MATLQTIPQTTVPVGPLVIGPTNIAGSVKQFVLILAQVSWPYAGDLAFTYACEYSNDNGNTWNNCLSGNVNDLPIPAKFGNPANQIKIVCTIPGTGSRKLRASFDFAKSLTVSGTLAAN